MQDITTTKHRQVACIQFDEDNTIKWYFKYGTIKEVTPFKYAPKRNIGDQFMNVDNDIVTTVLVCNNSVTSDDEACFFITLYQIKIIKKMNLSHLNNLSSLVKAY